MHAVLAAMRALAGRDRRDRRRPGATNLVGALNTPDFVQFYTLGRFADEAPRHGGV